MDVFDWCTQPHPGGLVSGGFSDPHTWKTLVVACTDLTQQLESCWQ